MKWKYFWLGLPLKIHSLLAVLSQYKQFPAHFACLLPARHTAWPGSITGSSLPIMLLQRPLFQWGQWKCQVFPPPSFRLQTWGGCGDFLLYGQMYLRCFSSRISVGVCCTSSAWFELTSATRTGLLLMKYPFFIKTLSSYRCKHHQFYLWTPVNEGTLL